MSPFYFFHEQWAGHGRAAELLGALAPPAMLSTSCSPVQALPLKPGWLQLFPIRAANTFCIFFDLAFGKRAGGFLSNFNVGGWSICSFLLILCLYFFVCHLNNFNFSVAASSVSSLPTWGAMVQG